MTKSLLNIVSDWIDEGQKLSELNKLYISSLFLTALLIPFSGIVVSYSIILNTVFFLLTIIRTDRGEFTRKNFLILFVLFYLIHAVGMIYTENKQSGWTDLQLKISLLILPVLFSVSASFIKINTEKVLLLFTLGCTVAGVACLILSLIQYSNDSVIEDFFYSRLSWFIHPAYYSMYLNFSLAFLGWNRMSKSKQSTVTTGWFYLICIFFILLIVLLSSKAGIITAVLLILIYIFLQFRNSQQVKNILFLLTIIILLAAAFYILRISSVRFETIKEIFQSKNIDKGTTESTAARMLTWKSAVTLLKSNWLVGTGSGDVNNELKQQYQKLGMTGIYEEGLNAHNQFLQTWLGTGIAGELLLILITVVTMIYAVKERDYLLALFLFLICCNFFTESMLQRQAGVIFFSFFLSLLVFRKKGITY